MASLGGTVLDLITSDISRLRGMSSLRGVSTDIHASVKLEKATHKLDEVARSTWSSKALLPDANQPAMVAAEVRRSGVRCRGCGHGNGGGSISDWRGIWGPA